MLTDEQQKVVDALDKHVLVSAGAGSGKTKVLVERYVQTLLQNPDKRSPSNIIAVTYTKRAASEMRNRIKARLDELIADEGYFHIKDKLLSFRLQIDSALIGTIHSLCDSILRTFPEEARVDPSFVVMETLDSVELIRQSAEQALLELSETDQRVQRLLSQYDIGNVVAWVKKTVDRRAEFETARRSLPELNAKELGAHAEQLLVAVQELCCDGVFKNNRLSSYLEYAAGFEHKDLRNAKVRIALQTVLAIRKRLGRVMTVAQQFACLKEIAQLKFDGGGRSGDDAALKEQLMELCIWVRQLVNAIPEKLNELDEEAFALIPALTASHGRAAKIYKAHKQRLKLLDFQDQIEAAHELLKNPQSRARQHFNEHLAAVLVDEFQDTNTLQSEIIGYLVGTDTKVLLIGDEKQSIYKFQGADLMVFSSWTNWFGCMDEKLLFNWKGERLLATLTRSFRGHPGLIIFLNNVFHHVLNGQGLMRGYHAEHKELVAARGGDVEPRTHLVHFFASHSGAAMTSEAEAVAVWIKDMVQVKTPVSDESGNVKEADYRDFAVLLPQHSSFQQFEEAFAHFNLPYASMGGKSFLSTQEVFDMENLLAFLNSQLNDQALFGILRSPFFGVSDDVLQVLCNHRQTANTLWQALKEFSPGETSDDKKLDRAVKILNLLLEAAQRVSLSELLRKAVELTNYDVTMLALPSGKRRSRNVWKFMSMAEEQESLTTAQFLQRLETARAAKVEERAAPLDAGNSIKLMTIHQAKGLEFPIVVLPCMDAKVNPGFKGTDEKLVFHPEYGIALNVGEGNNKPAYFQVCRYIQDELDAAEKRRLFYVAASRARDHLGIFLQDESIAHDCFHKWLTEALSPHEAPPPNSPMRQHEFHGAFGISPYLVWAPSFSGTPKEVQGYDGNGEDNKVGSGEQLIAQLADELKDGRALFKPVLRAELKAQAPKNYWLRATSAMPNEVTSSVLGTYFHSVMEYFAATKHKPDTNILEKLACYIDGRATDSDMQHVLMREVEGLLHVFYKSELYSITMNARKLMYERSYFLFSDDAESSASSKRPDLLLQDAAGAWRIIDYKTDAVTPDTLEQELRKHRQQILTYVNDIKAICSINAPGYLYFARTGQLCAVA